MSLSIRTAVAALLLAAPTSLALCASLAAQTPAPAAPATRPPAKALDYDSVAFARQVTQWFYAGQVDSLVAHSDSMLQVNFAKAQWTQATMQWTTRVGEESKLVEERWVKRNGLRQYWRIIDATEFTEQPVMLRWILEPGMKIGGVGMNPASQAPPVDPN